MQGIQLKSRLAVALAVCLVTSPALAVESATAFVRDQNSTWNRYFNHGNIDKLAKLYAAEAVVSPANGDVVKGRQAIRDLLQGYIENGLGDHRLEVIRAGGSGDWYYEVATWKATGAPENAVIPFYEGTATIVFRKNDDEWQIQSHTWNMKPDSQS